MKQTLLLLFGLIALLSAGCRPIGAGRDDDLPRTDEPGEERPANVTPAAAPAIVWDAAPTCQNQPQDLAAWRAEFPDDPAAAQGTVATLRLQTMLDQVHRYGQLLPDARFETMAAILAIEEDAGAEELRQRALAVLWLNLVSGRLNRATEILPGPDDESGGEVHSVGALLEQLAEAPAGSAEFDARLAEATAVAAGQSLGRQVCARLLYRAGEALYTAHWSNQGFYDASQSLADTPVGLTSFSPDFTRLVVQTPRGDTAGGPLYLFDLTTQELINLNERGGLPRYTSVSALEVAGWHPDNQHVLLVNEDDEVTIWFDLASGSYTPLALGIDTSELAPPRDFMLAPDGSGFTFVSVDRASNATNLFWYSLREEQSRLLLTIAADEGELDAFQIAPNGLSAAYLLRQGSRRTGRSEELRLLDLSTGESQLLLSGHLGPLQPVWSPTSEQIAFIRRNLTGPIGAGPRVEFPLGDVWTLSIGDRVLRQLTFTEALIRPPVWSLDEEYLAFVSEDGQLGMVATAQPGLIWRIETNQLQPQFTRLAFLP